MLVLVFLVVFVVGLGFFLLLRVVVSSAASFSTSAYVICFMFGCFGFKFFVLYVRGVLKVNIYLYVVGFFILFNFLLLFSAYTKRISFVRRVSLYVASIFLYFVLFVNVCV